MLKELAAGSPIWWVRLMGEHAHLGGPTATRRLLTMGGILRAEKVLDLGCYVGGTVRILAEEKECRTVGIDAAPQYVTVARALTTSAKAHYGAARAERLPLREGSFDAVISEDGRFSLDEVHRVLRKGGRFLLQGPVLQVLRDTIQTYRDYGFEGWWSEDMTDEAVQSFRKIRNEFVALRDLYVAQFGEEEYKAQLRDIEERILKPYEAGDEHHVRAVFTKEGPIHRRKLAHPKAKVETTVRRRRHRARS
jgi:SAM-dependent methyltransferase